VTRAKKILIGVAAGLGCIVFFVVAFMLGRGCAPKPDPELVLVTPPDAGEEGRAIDARLDAAVEQHEEAVRVIERRIVLERDAHQDRLDEEERAVRARGRAATASWLQDFNASLHDAGVSDAGP
jgi:hypothetical protein